jgi:hypothetical protein
MRRLAVLIDRYGGALAADFADRGQDLPQLWHAGRYRYIAAILDRLPRDSHYVAELADDDDIATLDTPPGRTAPPLTEFGPVVERLTAVVDLLGMLLAVQTTAPGRKPRLPSPLPRPVTAADRLRETAAEADRQWLAGRLFPT